MDGFTYLKKLQEAYYREGLQKEWDELTGKAYGIVEREKQALIEKYPNIPKSLLQILSVIDGTYYREYQDEEFCVYFFGSDVDDGEYPYYLHSFNDIMEDPYGIDNVADFDGLFEYCMENPDDECGVDERIMTEPEKMNWMCFSHCMNNGGTSQLFIDFTPSEKGKYGQIVRYLHDPDRLDVIADSFDEFLDMLVDNGMRFVQPD